MTDLPPGIDDLIRRALAEDLGAAGDLTSIAVVPAAQRAMGDIVMRQNGRVAGLEAALWAFSLHDPSIETTAFATSGPEPPSRRCRAGPVRSSAQSGCA